MLSTYSQLESFHSTDLEPHASPGLSECERRNLKLDIKPPRPRVLRVLSFLSSLPHQASVEEIVSVLNLFLRSPSQALLLRVFGTFESRNSFWQCSDGTVRFDFPLRLSLDLDFGEHLSLPTLMLMITLTHWGSGYRQNVGAVVFGFLNLQVP